MEGSDPLVSSSSSSANNLLPFFENGTNFSGEAGGSERERG